MKKTLLTSVSMVLSAAMLCAGAVTAFADEDDWNDFVPDAALVIQGEYRNDFVTTTIPGDEGSSRQVGISLNKLRASGFSENDLHVYLYQGENEVPSELSSYVDGRQICFTADGGDTVIVSEGALEKRWVRQEFEDDDD